MQKKPEEKQPIDVFERLSIDQLRYITARLENPEFTKKSAAQHIGVKPKTVYMWPSYVDDALQLAVEDIHNAARSFRKQALLQAVAVKVDGLKSKDEKVRQSAATEIIEWELGRATQPHELTGKSGGPIVVFKSGMDVDNL